MLLLAGMITGCSSVHIQTGPPTDSELTAQTEDSGRRFVATWADRLQNASPLQQADMLRFFMDSTTARYLRFGEQVNGTWRDEGKRRGSQVPVEEIRKMVERSTQIDLPMLEAYEDVLEYGVDLIKEQKSLEPSVAEKLIEYRDLYIEIYSGVFYPNGTREEYENLMQSLGVRAQEMSRELEISLDKLR
jgi:hypothetical protein